MEKQIRVGIIGANPNGSWGTNAHIPALQASEQLMLSGVATSRLETAQQTAHKFDIPHAFAGPDELVVSNEIDVVSVCVRVPHHFELVKMALEAGKHVYCEWPLAKDTAEASQLQALAADKGLVNMIGLQARYSPVLRFLKDQLAEGRIGRVLACHLNHSVDWMPQLPSSMTYLQDFSSGAHMLSIPGGHSIDTLCWLFGEFEELSAFVATQINAISVVDNGQKHLRTSPDQIMVSGVTTDGVMASLRIQGGSRFGTGLRFEINGEKGDLVIGMEPNGRGIQMSDLELFSTSRLGVLEPVTIPDHYYQVPPTLRSGPPLNVAHGYQALASAILGSAKVTDFEHAVLRHKTLDAIMQSSTQRKIIRNI